LGVTVPLTGSVFHDSIRPLASPHYWEPPITVAGWWHRRPASNKSNAGIGLGNFPQAFSYVGLINTARNLTRHGGPADDRQNPTGPHTE
jgi:hypothetical protein